MGPQVVGHNCYAHRIVQVSTKGPEEPVALQVRGAIGWMPAFQCEDEEEQ